MDDEISKTEDMQIRAWIRREKGVRVNQYGLWRLTPEEAMATLKNEYGVVVTVQEIKAAARRIKPKRVKG